MQKTFSSFIFFPNARMTFVAPNPEAASVPREGLPNLLYTRRKALRLSKQKTARRLGVCQDVIGMWERGEHQPRVMFMPAIIDFLGDDSWLPTASFADRLRRFRALRGWTQERLGRWLGFDERTIGRWEEGVYPSAYRRDEVECRLTDAEGQEKLEHRNGCAAR